MKTQNIIWLALIASILVPVGAAASVLPPVQQANTDPNGITANPTIARAFSSNVAAGNVILAYLWFKDVVTISQVQDTQGNTFTIIPGTLAHDTVHNWYTQIAYAPITTGGSDTVTVTLSGSGQLAYLFIAEYSNILSLDKTATNTGTISGGGGTATAGPVTTVVDGELIFAGFFDAGGTGNAAGSGYTAEGPLSYSLTEDQVQRTAGSILGTITYFGSVDSYIASMVTFRASVSGVQVSSRSDTLSDSRRSATSNHAITFTPHTAVYGSSISGSSTVRVILPSSFSTPATMDCGDVDVATSSNFNFNYPGCQATATAWGFSATSAVISLIPPTGSAVHVATGTPLTIWIGSSATSQQQGVHWITNPLTAGIYTISVGGTFGGSGNILVSINSAVSVQVAVAESLSFSVASVAAGSCTADDGATVTAIDTTPTLIAFGNLFPANTFFFGCQDLVVSTNAGGGYLLTVQEQTLLQSPGGFTMPQTTCDGAACTLTTAAAWTTPTNNGFGHTCKNQTNHDCAATYSSGSNFRPTANVAAGDAAQTIMSSSTPASATGRIKYRVSSGSSQPAGDYKTIITYTITPTY